MVTLPRTPEFTLKNNNRSKSKGNQDTYQELDATTNQPTNIAASQFKCPRGGSGIRIHRCDTLAVIFTRLT